MQLSKRHLQQARPSVERHGGDCRERIRAAGHHPRRDLRHSRGVPCVRWAQRSRESRLRGRTLSVHVRGLHVLDVHAARVPFQPFRPPPRFWVLLGLAARATRRPARRRRGFQLVELFRRPGQDFHHLCQRGRSYRFERMPSCLQHERRRQHFSRGPSPPAGGLGLLPQLPNVRRECRVVSNPVRRRQLAGSVGRHGPDQSRQRNISVQVQCHPVGYRQRVPYHNLS